MTSTPDAIEGTIIGLVRWMKLFLVLGTGLGSAMIVDGIVVPMELAHLPYRKATYEDYVGIRGLKKHGKKSWRRHVKDVVKRLSAALEPGDSRARWRQRQ